MKLNKILTTALAACCSFAVMAQTLSYPLVSTGQVECYDLNGEKIKTPKSGDELYGQDGNYKAGLPMSYKDNGDGTVSDLNTGLMWEQTPAAGPVTWAEAQKYCDELNLAGHGDWRLPTLKELYSISNFSAGWPYLDTKYFKLSVEGRVDKDEQYWGQEKYVGETVEGRGNAAFGVNHATGHIKAYPAGGDGGERGGDRPQQARQRGGQRDQQGGRPPMPQGADSLRRPPMPDSARMANMPDSLRRQAPPLQQGEQAQRPPQGQQGGQRQGGQRPQMAGGQQGGGAPQMMGNPMQKRVRAVRGDLYGVNNFVDNGDGTISDKATGLMWAKSDNGEGVMWADAVKYAESSELAGHTDWRLPNVKELQSIVDYRYAPSSKEFKPAIDPMFNCTPFVNEAKVDDYGYYWTNTSALFRADSPFYFAWYVAFGRAVNGQGLDMHGAGAVRFDSKSKGVAVEGGEERYNNFVRLVRVER
ncbi:MAG: DUF1566 domain-containing protein [Rikenellaceae bacterium]